MMNYFLSTTLTKKRKKFNSNNKLGSVITALLFIRGIMSKKGERICMLCKNTYQFCPVCNPIDQLKPTWYFCWCSQNCKDIDDVTCAFEDGRMTDIEAKAKLDKLDLSRQEYFGESYKRSIASINKAKPQYKKIDVNKAKNKIQNVSTKNVIVTETKEKVDSNVE